MISAGDLSVNGTDGGGDSGEESYLRDNYGFRTGITAEMHDGENNRQSETDLDERSSIENSSVEETFTSVGSRHSETANDESFIRRSIETRGPDDYCDERQQINERQLYQPNEVHSDINQTRHTSGDMPSFAGPKLRTNALYFTNKALDYSKPLNV